MQLAVLLKFKNYRTAILFGQFDHIVWGNNVACVRICRILPFVVFLIGRPYLPMYFNQYWRFGVSR
jgi:hypothetical protein